MNRLNNFFLNHKKMINILFAIGLVSFYIQQFDLVNNIAYFIPPEDYFKFYDLFLGLFLITFVLQFGFLIFGFYLIYWYNQENDR
jgi:hypothetical protein